MSEKTSGAGEKLLYCSFCGKSQHEVVKLIAGPKVFICDECIQLCNDIIKEESGSEKTPGKTKGDLTPADIFRLLSGYVVEQDNAKKILALAVHDHYTRLNALDRGASDDIELQKSNILLAGPTGSGKTLLAQTLARMLNVPFVIADATKMTEAGYVGEDVESMLQKLLSSCDYDVKKAERGIIYLDEVDKIARRADLSIVGKDVNGEGVQQALLKILEGTIASVPPQGGRKSPNADYVQLDTRNILFILGGAFNGLTKEIAKRKNAGQSIGFHKNGAGEKVVVSHELLLEVEPVDLVEYGLIPELVGRVPIIAALHELSEDALVSILFEPKDALCKQFAKLVKYQGAELVVTPDAARAIARQAKKRGTGGRGLRTILERALREFRYDLPEIQKGEKKVKKATVTEETILSGARPEIEWTE